MTIIKKRGLAQNLYVTSHGILRNKGWGVPETGIGIQISI